METENTVVALQTPFETRRVQCVGLNFVKYLATIHYGESGGLSTSSSEEKISDSTTEFVVDVDYLRSLDPKEWKDQDHYAVLGLKHLRNAATDDDIKRAYRKIVLKHHPDKRKAQGEEIRTDDDYFTCIIRAYETLSVPAKRRSYDSVDPEFDDTLPSQQAVEKDFYGVLGPQFELNKRWSEKRNVPLLGDDNSDRDAVEKFYDFWYNFQSWREYSYLDEEDKDKGQDREERRWIEKQNKQIRIKRKKEENSRIRALVDLAYNNDPRIVRFKKEEKEKKLAAKRAKQTAAQQQKAEEERLIREAELKKQEAEKAEQKRIEQIQKEREAQKRALKKEKKIFRDTMKANDYYAADDKEKLKNMEGIDKICELMKTLELQELNKNMATNGKEAFLKALQETEEKMEEERRRLFGPPKTAATPSANSAVKPAVNRKQLWTLENIQLLIKAVNLFPAGTVQRWEVVANFLNQHATNLGDAKFSAKEVLNKTKDMQHSDFSKSDLKAQTNQNAFESFEKNKKELKVVDNSEISVNDENAEQLANGSTAKVNGTPMVNGKKPEKTESKEEAATTTTTTVEPKTWTKEEQSLLEQAIKTYPVSTADRWDRIAECIPGRTKKECLKRVKELVDQVNAKKKAMAK
ncbi:dnaJ homolog subfamily C member 2 [Culicoides brevitarsis]|uniref:dnaJ homolog subfamily C member 2 n=1 Tax=Culicoides brevitarsis TaxID=469753 RepID=UPI00307BDC17